MKKTFLILAFGLLTACHNDPPIVGPVNTQNNSLKEHMINANRTIAQSEETAIDEYISRYGWTMTKLPEGARVWEYEKGSGKPISFEDSVSIRYNVEAINGKTLYTNVQEHFVAGRKRDMIGLDQAVRSLHYGSRAKIILPSNLAYGVGGDGDRIPQSAILVIDLTIDN